MNKTHFRESLLVLVNCLEVMNQVQGYENTLVLAISKNRKLAVMTTDSDRLFNSSMLLTGWMEIDRTVDYFEGWIKAQELVSEAGEGSDERTRD